MKPITTALVAALFCCLCAHSLSAAPQDKKSKEEKPIPEVVGLNPTLPSHPRLLMLKGEEKALKKAIGKDVVWTEINSTLLDEATKIIDLPLSERIKTGRRLLSVSRENLRRIFILSYAYRMTGKSEFLARAEAEMLKIASFEDWNPSHFLDVGEMTMALAIGYDWLYAKLSPATRETIEKAIIEKGIVPSFDDESGDNWFVDVTHNWNQVCHAGVSYGALAVWEKNPELAQKTLNRAIEMVKLPMEHYGPDGAYPEGPGYWEYGTSFNVMFLSAIEKAFGSDFGLAELPGFMKTGDYILNIVTPGMKNFAYSDNGFNPSFSSTMFWFYNKTEDASILYNITKLYKQNGPDAIRRNRLAPAMLIWGATASLENPQKPTELMWTAGGDNPVAFIRSSWDDPAARFLGVKLGSPKVNHGHMDVGSFIFEADGVDWAMDMGSENYNSIEVKGVSLWTMKQDSQRWYVYRYNNHSHNTLSFNRQLQQVDSAKAEIDAFSNDEKHQYVVSDLSQVYRGQVKSAKRAFSLVDKDYAVIEDLIETKGSFTMMTWNLTTSASVKQVSDNVVLLEKDGKKLYVKVDCPEPIRWQIQEAKSRYTFDSPISGITHVAFDTDLKLSAKQKITVYLIPGSDRKVDFKPVLD